MVRLTSAPHLQPPHPHQAARRQLHQRDQSQHQQQQPRPSVACASSAAAAGGNGDSSSGRVVPPLVLGPLEKKVVDLCAAATRLFPLWVLLAAATGYQWPDLYLWFNNTCISWGLMFVMTGMGLTLTFAEIGAVFTRQPQLLALGMVLQVGSCVCACCMSAWACAYTDIQCPVCMQAMHCVWNALAVSPHLPSHDSTAPQSSQVPGLRFCSCCY